MRTCAFLSLSGAAAFAQEASSGFELRTTVESAVTSYSQELQDAPRDGSPATGGFRAILYPTWKLNSNWTISGSLSGDLASRYFAEDFDMQGNGVKGELLQLNLSYARFWDHHRSVVVRVGQMSSAFGAFLQRYDSMENPLIGIPPAYGYYYNPVTFLGLVGAQMDATAGKFDARAQFVNSSPANRRSIFESDQYGNWAGGGYIDQGRDCGWVGQLITVLTWIVSIRFFSRARRIPKLYRLAELGWTSNGVGATGTFGAKCSDSRWITARFPLSCSSWATAKCGGT